MERTPCPSGSDVHAAAFDLACRFRAGAQVLAGWVGQPDPFFAEMVARSPLEGVVLDMQHGLHDAGTVVRSIGVIVAAGKPALVRIPVGDVAMASRALDMGAAGVIAPMINSAAEARQFADAMKYPPLGRRSWGPGRAMMLAGTTDPAWYLAHANRDTLALAMIETREALDAIDEILAVDGIDGVFVGPSDLSIALSGGVMVDPDAAAIDVALARVKARTAAAGKVAGVFGGEPARARDFVDLGFSLVTVGFDSAYMKAGIEAMIGSVEGHAAAY